MSTLLGSMRRAFRSERRVRNRDDWYKDEPMVDLAPRRRLELQANGFLASTALIYEFERYGFDAYVNMRDYRPLHPINGPFSRLIDDKGFIPILLRDHSQWLPRVSIVAAGDRLYYLHGVESNDQSPRKAVECGLARCKRLFAKPCFGGGGKDVVVISEENKDDFCSSLSRSPRTFMLIQSYLKPEAYSAAIFPGVLNTYRVLFFKNKRNEMRILRILHRFGTSESAPVDNTARGGLISRVDIESGTLTEGLVYRGNSKPQWHSRHPETARPVKGYVIDDWQDKIEQMRDLLNRINFLDYGGLDIAPTTEGLKLLEINSRPSLVVSQADGPLLADEEFAEFLFEKGYPRPQ